MITPLKEEYMVGEKVTCSGNANPPVDYYIWQDITSGVTLIQGGRDEYVLTMKEEWVGRGKLTVRCSLTNTVRHRRRHSNSAPFTFEVLSK